MTHQATPAPLLAPPSPELRVEDENGDEPSAKRAKTTPPCTNSDSDSDSDSDNPTETHSERYTRKQKKAIKDMDAEIEELRKKAIHKFLGAMNQDIDSDNQAVYDLYGTFGIEI